MIRVRPSTFKKASQMASKFRVRMKLQGFELEIEGNREDASTIGRNIGEQISSLLAPGMNIVDGEVVTPSAKVLQLSQIPDDAPMKKPRRRGRASPNGADREKVKHVDFRHDPMKYGSPNQQWKTAQKAIWLLYVVKEATGFSELTTGQIVKTFNTHFRQAKTVTSSNVSRDLGRLKIASPAPIGEDTTKSPPAWYLTDDGVRRAQALVSELLTPTS